MSKAVVALKPKVVSSFSKATPITRPDCRSHFSSAAWQHPCQNGRSLHSASALEDAFVTLLISAGRCERERSFSSHRRKHTSQRRCIATGAASRNDETTAAFTDDRTIPSHIAPIQEHNTWRASAVPEKRWSRGSAAVEHRRLDVSNATVGTRATFPAGYLDGSKDNSAVQTLNTTRSNDASSNGGREVESTAVAQPVSAQTDQELKERYLRAVNIYSPSDSNLDLDIMEGELETVDEVNMYGSLAWLHEQSGKAVQTLEDDIQRPNTRPIFASAQSADTASNGRSITNDSMDRLAAASATEARPASGETHYPLAPRLTISPFEEEAMRKAPTLRMTRSQVQCCLELIKMLDQEPGTIQILHAWRLLLQLPYPHVHYLPNRTIRRLVSHLMFTQHRRNARELEKINHFIQLCDAAKIDIDVSQWTSLMVLIGRAQKVISADDVKMAVDAWTRMEDRGVQADAVVFNVLIHIAIKAGRLALADTILKEMKERKMPLNRYFRCSMIARAAASRDGDAVRAAFAEFVHGGELVDTAVMNLVVLSLIQCGEGEAAEAVFMNMKQLHAERFAGKSGDWISRRRLAKQLDARAKALRSRAKSHTESFFGSSFSQQEEAEQLQQATPVNPDVTTYAFIIRYHIYSTGDIARITELLQEMEAQQMPIHGGLFADLFEGFNRHGGSLFSPWTPALLENIWSAFRARVAASTKNNKPPTYVDTMQGDIVVGRAARLDDRDTLRSHEHLSMYYGPTLTQSVLHAFRQCFGRLRMYQVWREIEEQIKDRMDDPAWDAVRRIVRKAVNE